MGIFYAMELKYINLSFALSVAVSAVAFALFLWTTDAVETLYGWKRNFLIVMLFVYSGYRIFRVVKDFKKIKKNEK
jgi:hypothetical protein